MSRDVPADIHSHTPSHQRQLGLLRSCLLLQLLLLQCSSRAVSPTMLCSRGLLPLRVHSSMAVSLTVLRWRGLLLLPGLLGVGRTCSLLNLNSSCWLLPPSLLSVHRAGSLRNSHCRHPLLLSSLLSAEWSGHLAESSRGLLLLHGLLNFRPRGRPRKLPILASLPDSLPGGRHRCLLLPPGLLSMGGAGSLPGKEGCCRAELGRHLQRLRWARRAVRQQRDGALGSPAQQPHRRCSSPSVCLHACMGCCLPLLHLSTAGAPGHACTRRAGRPVGGGSRGLAELPAANSVAEAQAGICRQHHPAGDCVMLWTKVWTGSCMSRALTD